MSPDGRLEVLIVGCGNIAGGFDNARAADEPPLTHAGAFSRHPAFRLAACVDPDDARHTAFAHRWGVPLAAREIRDLSSAAGRFDVISICSPTALHGTHLETALALQPRLVFCEKPVTPTLAETLEWVQRFAVAGVPLAINHTRRWAPDIVRLGAELRAGCWGSLRAATGHYNKGVLNNGAHMIDLLHALLGPVQPVAAGAPVWDYWPDDPSVPAMLYGEGGVPVQLNVGHAGDCALFELQLVTSHAVITMEDGGQAWRVRRIVESQAFKGYRTLTPGGPTAGEYAQAMTGAVANLHGALVRGEPLASTGASAAAAQTVCEAMRTMSLKHHQATHSHCPVTMENPK
jgi:predicted dehydrogenase